MKGIIIYKGKYGATEQYAKWLGEELNLAVKTSGEIHGAELNEYDLFLIGTSVYIGKLQIQKWLKNNLPFVKGKKIFLFQVAGSPPTDIKERQSYNQACIPASILDQCESYFLHGKMIVHQLSWVDRFMLKMGARLKKDPVEKKTMLTDYNDVKKENIAPIVKAVRSFLNSKEEEAREYHMLPQMG